MGVHNASTSHQWASREDHIRSLGAPLNGPLIFSRRIPYFIDFQRDREKEEDGGKLLTHINPTNPYSFHVSSLLFFSPLPLGHLRRVSFFAVFASPSSAWTFSSSSFSLEAMSSSEGENHSSERILCLPGTEELSRVRPPPSYNEEDVPFRIVRRPH